MRGVHRALQFPAVLRAQQRNRCFATAINGEGDIPNGNTSHQTAYERTGIVHEQDVLKRELPETPDALQDGGAGAGKSISAEELQQRKSAAVRTWMTTLIAIKRLAADQEGQVGRDKIEAAQILKDHNVLVRGGPEQGTKLMEALVAWKNKA